MYQFVVTSTDTFSVSDHFVIFLLQNITKHLTPNFHGFTNLCKAHSVMMKVAADINETQRLYEASIRVQVNRMMCVCVC